MNNLRVTISIDDVNPKPGWRILGECTEQYLKSLHEEFGCKYTLFVPSCYHREFPLSEHKGWVKELSSLDWLELAAHGHYHQTSDPKRFGECEFAELNYEDAAARIYQSWDEWFNCDYMPEGFRPPGWIVSTNAQKAINFAGGKWYKWGMWERNWFSYYALHYEHNHGMRWVCKEFFGHDGIQQENISVHNDNMIMFTSHIAGDWNDNVWNESNYQQLKLSLSYLVENYNCEFRTLYECL